MSAVYGSNLIAAGGDATLVQVLPCAQYLRIVITAAAGGGSTLLTVSIGGVSQSVRAYVGSTPVTIEIPQPAAGNVIAAVTGGDVAVSWQVSYG